MIDLFGEYNHKVDAKGRVALPSRFRKELPDDLVVTVDPFGECLYVFTPEAFNDWVADFFAQDGGFNPRSRSHSLQRTKLKTGARATEIDGSGRINIPADLREKVGIERDVSIIGNTGYFEIWDAKRWESQSSAVDLTSMFVD